MLDSIVGANVEEIECTLDIRLLDLRNCHRLKKLELFGVHCEILLRDRKTIDHDCLCLYPDLDTLIIVIRSSNVKKNLLWEEVLQDLIPSCSRHRMSEIWLDGEFGRAGLNLNIKFPVDSICICNPDPIILSIGQRVKTLKHEEDVDLNVTTYNDGVIDEVGLYEKLQMLPKNILSGLRSITFGFGIMWIW